MRGLALLCLALPVASFANYALRFDGKSLTRMNYSPALTLTRGLTMEAWVKPESADPDQFFRYLISHNMGSTGYGMLLKKNSNFQANDMESQAAIPPVGRWTHIAYAHNNRVAKLYFDGKLVHTSQVAHPLQPNQEFFWVGSSPFAGNPGNQLTGFSGLIDEVRVWSVPRSGRQIKRDMRRLLSPRTTNLRVYLTLDEGKGEEAKNRTARTGPLLMGAKIAAAHRAPTWEKVPSLRRR